MKTPPLPPACRQLLRRAAHLPVRHWPDYSRLFLIHDISSWVIAWEMRELAGVCRSLNIRQPHRFWMPFSERQCTFYGSQFFLLHDDWLARSHRVATAWFHGRPGSGEQVFEDLFNRVAKHHERIDRIQVSHRAMQEVVCDTGIDPDKVHLIPIGINPAYFSRQTPENKRAARQQFGIPEQAVAIGSFQKDGTGWEDGREPKLIKGPDVFVQAMNILRERIPQLHVVLSAPARGYVKQALADAGISFTHHQLEHYPDIETLYHSLDAYVVASREEGGPKAVLESMACGIPLITTRVGQATDLVEHGRNGCLVDVEDAEGLAHFTEWVLDSEERKAALIQAGLQTANQHSYANQLPQWKTFFEGFVTP